MLKSTAKDLLIYLAFLFYLTGCGSSGSDTENTLGGDADNTLDGDTENTLGGDADNTLDGDTENTLDSQDPGISVNSDASSITYNDDITISWSSNEVSDCLASGDWTGSIDTSGSQDISDLTKNSIFTITCTISDGTTVSDNVSVTVALNNTGTVLLSWTPPTENTDGSHLTNLAGYKILYGSTPGNYSKTITIDNPGITSYQVENLHSANWYFVMLSFNSDGAKSDQSPEIRKLVN